VTRHDIHGYDGHRQAGSLQLAGLVQARQGREAAVVTIVIDDDIGACVADAVRGVDDAVARAGSCAIGDGDVDKGAGEAQVDTHEDEGEHHVAGDAAEEEEGEGRVDDGDARDALDGLDPVADEQAVVVQSHEKVGEDA